MKKFRFTGPDVLADLRDRYGYEGDLATIYAGNTGPIVHKWHHYLPLYDRYFGPFRGKPVRFLEIGVFKGGSLAMWRQFLGPEAVIFGIDINPDCAAFDGQAGQVRIGSQDDPAFLEAVVAEMGGLDVVLDDGSHEMAHIDASLKVLFPHVSLGGIYAIEDLHTAYWRAYGGGPSRPTNFFAEVRRMIDDMHHWYYPRAPQDPERAATITGLHVHDSLVVIDKGTVHRPTDSFVGRK